METFFMSTARRKNSPLHRGLVLAKGSTLNTGKRFSFFPIPRRRSTSERREFNELDG
jgi:hypothetical protein